MKKFITIYVVVVLLGASCTASVELDQSQITYGGGWGIGTNNILAQTFTPGLSGKLDHIDVQLGSAYPTAIPVTVSIVETISSVPSGNLLGSVTMPDIGFGGWKSFDFLSENINLTAGTLYAIQVITDRPFSSPGISWYYSNNNSNPYSNGCLWLYQTYWRNMDLIHNASDATFKTFMLVPEPATIAMLGIGALSLLRKKK